MNINNLSTIKDPKDVKPGDIAINFNGVKNTVIAITPAKYYKVVLKYDNSGWIDPNEADPFDGVIDIDTDYLLAVRESSNDTRVYTYGNEFLGAYVQNL